MVVNVLTNACQALEDSSKKVTVSTEFRGDIGSVVIIVTDEGVGIPEKDLNRILDPFFTTKRGSGGTGLVSRFLRVYIPSLEYNKSIPGIYSTSA